MMIGPGETNNFDFHLKDPEVASLEDDTQSVTMEFELVYSWGAGSIEKKRQVLRWVPQEKSWALVSEEVE